MKEMLPELSRPDKALKVASLLYALVLYIMEPSKLYIAYMS